MRLLLVTILTILFVTLQISLSPVVSICSILPNFILIFLFFIAFSVGQTCGMWVGFFSGFLCDMFDPPHFGLNLTLFLLFGFIVGSIRAKFYKDNLFVSLIIFVISIFIYEIFYTLLLWQFSPGVYFLNILRYSIPRVLYSSVIGIFLFPLLKRIPFLTVKN